MELVHFYLHTIGLFGILCPIVRYSFLRSFNVLVYCLYFYHLFREMDTHCCCVLYGCHGNKVYCCESHDSHLEIMWTFVGDSPFYSTPFVVRMSALVVVCCSSVRGSVYLLDLSDGSQLGHLRLPGDVFSSPVAVGSEIVVGCRDDNVYCIQVSVHSDHQDHV